MPIFNCGKRQAVAQVCSAGSQSVTETGMIHFQVTAAGFYSNGGRILGFYVVQRCWSVPTFQSFPRPPSS